MPNFRDPSAPRPGTKLHTLHSPTNHCPRCRAKFRTDSPGKSLCCPGCGARLTLRPASTVKTAAMIQRHGIVLDRALSSPRGRR